MATNKHATIRYHALDKCFSNYGRRFFLEDLIEACNNAIHEFSGIQKGVKRRQIFKDITFMESEQGWSIPLERLKDGRRVFYRYSDKNFSIKSQGLNPTEAEQLIETLTIFSRFKGMPQFEWIEEMQIRLKDTFKLGNKFGTIIGFEQNPYLTGLNFFTELFNAIQNEVALKIKYQGYRQDKPSEIILHPWFLKQYNNRWFLFGQNNDYQSITNFALDRIIAIRDANIQYLKNTEIDFDEYFEDILGVTYNAKDKIEKVVLKINLEIWPYICSKPIHGSQKVLNKDDSFVMIELNLQINYELKALLFSYMDAIEIMEPIEFRAFFKSVSESMFNKYF